VTFLGEASKADLSLRVEGYAKSYGEHRILESSGFTVMNGERVALVGSNGSGKTSLVRDIVARGSWDDATLRVGPSMVIGYCAQAQEVFDPANTVEDEFLKIMPTRREAFSHLGRFLFGWDDLDKRIADLSGGELNRLQLARASALRANFLILDEPTNHLDIPTREAVEEALADFDGTVLVVSHDRYFIEKVAERVVFIAEGRLNEYEGGFSEYWRDVGSQRSAPRRGASGGIERRGRTTRVAASDRAPSDTEARIEAMERERERLERESAAAFDARDYKRAKAIASELERHNGTLQKLWIEFIG
jgi:ATP-binding cassette subfamily F protein 3